MKISKSKLKQIIKEELQAVLAESYHNEPIGQAWQDRAARHRSDFLGPSVGEKIAGAFKITPTSQKDINHLKELEKMIGEALREGDPQRARNLHKHLKADKIKAQIDRIPALKYLRKKLPVIGGLTVIGSGVFAMVYQSFARAKTPEDYEKATAQLVEALKSQEGQDELTALTGVGSIAQMVRDAFEAIGAPDDDRINPGGKPMTMAQRRAALKMGPSARDQARARELALKYGTKN